MTKVQLASLKIESVIAKSFYVSNPGVMPNLDLLEKFERRDHWQRFAWFREAINFFPVGDSAAYYLEVVLDDSYSLDLSTVYAFSVPFFVDTEMGIEIGGDDYGEILPIRNIPIGVYKLIYQERYLTQLEIDQLSDDRLLPADPKNEPWESLGAKTCKLTFIQCSTRPEPEILKPLVGREIKEVFLHNYE